MRMCNDSVFVVLPKFRNKNVIFVFVPFFLLQFFESICVSLSFQCAVSFCQVLTAFFMIISLDLEVKSSFIVHSLIYMMLSLLILFLMFLSM